MVIYTKPNNEVKRGKQAYYHSSWAIILTLMFFAVKYSSVCSDCYRSVINETFAILAIILASFYGTVSSGRRIHVPPSFQDGSDRKISS